MHLLLLSVCIITSAFADDKPPVIKNLSDAEIRPKVEDSRDNIFQERVNNESILKNTPKKCLATSVADLEHKTTWQAKWHYSGVGTIRLPDAKISPDRSLLTIIENTGKPGAPSGSRIVMINCYNFEILRVIELPEQLLTALCYIPGTNQLIAAIDRQQSLKQSFGYMVIDLTGRTRPQKIGTTEKIIALACSNKDLFTVTDNGTLAIFDLAVPTKPPVAIKSEKKITALTFAPATNRLLTTANSRLEYLKISTMAPDIYAGTKLPTGFKPHKIIITDNKGSCLLLEKNSRFIFAKNRQIREFNKEPGTAADFSQTKQLLAIAIRHKQLLQLYQLPMSEKIKPCEPRKLKPKTGGDIIMLAFLPEPPAIKIEQGTKLKAKTKGKKTKKVKKKIKKKQQKPSTRLIVIDSHGNIYTLKHFRRRWSKNLIIAPKK